MRIEYMHVLEWIRRMYRGDRCSICMMLFDPNEKGIVEVNATRSYLVGTSTLGQPVKVRAHAECAKDRSVH